MIPTQAKLIADLKTAEEKPTRNGYGEGVVRAAKKNENIVVLCADLTESTRNEGFKKEFPERFVQMGVHEQLLAALAAGMAAVGENPFHYLIRNVLSRARVGNDTDQYLPQ